jgi:hypothetical protein
MPSLSRLATKIAATGFRDSRMTNCPRWPRSFSIAPALCVGFVPSASDVSGGLGWQRESARHVSLKAHVRMLAVGGQRLLRLGGHAVRFMAKVTIPSGKWEEAHKSGTLQGTIDSALQRLRPEASYFLDVEGARECIVVFNLDVPAMLKPLFPNLDASFEARQVTTGAEIQQQFGASVVQQPTEAPELLDDIRPSAPAQVPSKQEMPVESERESSDPDEGRDSSELEEKSSNRTKPAVESAAEPRADRLRT